MVLVFVFFFFSSRRRHTRSLCDWSSDVCSSDLPSGRGMRCSASRSTPGRIAAATMKPRKTSAITIFSCQSASASAITATATTVATKALRAVSVTAGRFSPCSTGCKRRSEAVFGEPGRAVLARDEEVCFDARRHGVSLARPLAQAALLAGAGAVLLAMPWSPLAVPGAALVVVAAAVCLRAVRLRSVESLELEQSLPGRLLGYGTLVAGPLEIEHVPHPRSVYRLVERLAG